MVLKAHKGRAKDGIMIITKKVGSAEVACRLEPALDRAADNPRAEGPRVHPNV